MTASCMTMPIPVMAEATSSSALARSRFCNKTHTYYDQLGYLRHSNAMEAAYSTLASLMHTKYLTHSCNQASNLLADT